MHTFISFYSSWLSSCVVAVSICSLYFQYTYKWIYKILTLKLGETYIDILCKVNPDFTTMVRIEKGKKESYLRILKLCYMAWSSRSCFGTISVLQEIGFHLKPYDKCIANNKIIDGKQCTMSWYIDDNLLSHANENIIENIVAKIETRVTGSHHHQGARVYVYSYAEDGLQGRWEIKY